MVRVGFCYFEGYIINPKNLYMYQPEPIFKKGELLVVQGATCEIQERKERALQVATETVQKFDGKVFDALADTIILLWEEQDKSQKKREEIKPAPHTISFDWFKDIYQFAFGQCNDDFLQQQYHNWVATYQAETND